MKKNLILFFVLIILLVGTYLFQEQRTINQKEEERTRTQLIKDQDISSLAWGMVEIQKKDAQWWMGDKLISHNLMGQILKKISSLKFVKSVEGEKKNYFSNPIDLKVNGEQWSFGDMTLDRQGFYLARGEKVIVAFIEGASGEITDDESKLEEIKLEDLNPS